MRDYCDFLVLAKIFLVLRILLVAQAGFWLNSKFWSKFSSLPLSGIEDSEYPPPDEYWTSEGPIRKKTSDLEWPKSLSPLELTPEYSPCKKSSSRWCNVMCKYVILLTKYLSKWIEFEVLWRLIRYDSLRLSRAYTILKRTCLVNDTMRRIVSIMSFPQLMTSSRATKLSPGAGDKTSQKPQLDAWRKKSSLLQSEVKIVNGVKRKAKNRSICCWNFSKLYFSSRLWFQKQWHFPGFTWMRQHAGWSPSCIVTCQLTQF